jgi:hypothetical protein
MPSELMRGALLHVLFDVLAWISAGVAGLWLTRIKHVSFPASPAPWPYVAFALLGAGIGAVVFGSANLWLSGQGGLGRSIEGAIAGAILAVEIYKRYAGIEARTGARFALPLAVGIAIGRVGCFLAGIDDFTYGTPTALPWGHDFGDGVPRHPVQLYESARCWQRPCCTCAPRFATTSSSSRTAFILLSDSTGCSALFGNSSNRMAQSSGRSRFFTACPQPSSPMRS